MIETGFTGRKGKGGFYRLNTESGKRVKESIDLKTGEYHPRHRPTWRALRQGARDFVPWSSIRTKADVMPGVFCPIR
ncbi:MAG: hypothetical protein Ct9H300mP13_5230 [Gammaproteobacteria bacterium]|nr:MAG: hypothetical protein Ct9H300mP13_5230 [Gammaproteobacteria bacterium]